MTRNGAPAGSMGSVQDLGPTGAKALFHRLVSREGRTSSVA